jgi:hypothetical protein
MGRIEFTVFTRADCNLAWKIFSDCKNWNRFLNVYGRIQWRGEAWAPGSRLLVELFYPVTAVQDRVITICTPPRCVAWINHVLGYTLEQWVLFDPCPGGGTRISTWIDIAGKELSVEGQDICEMVYNFVERWYRKFAEGCDREAKRI